MTTCTSAIAPIRNRLLSGVCLPVAAAAPIALGVSLAGPAARAQEVLSTNRNTSLYTSQSVIHITNTGSITDSGTGTDPGDVVTGVGIQSSPGWSFTNDGTIHITGHGQFTQADAVYASSSGTITNNGLISAPNAYVGIYFTNGGSNKAVVENLGTIIGNLNSIRSKSPIEIVNGSETNSDALIKNTVAPGLNYNQSLAAVRLDVSFHPSTLINYGTIEGTRDAVSSTGTVAITNHGKIIAAPGYSAINFTNGANSTVTLKDGSLVVGMLSSARADLNASLRLEGSGSLSDAITNFSHLTLDGTDWTLGGTGSTITGTTIQSGALRVNGSLASTIGIGSGGTLAGTGAITGDVTAQSGGTVQPGGAGTPGELTVTGNYTQMDGGTLAIQTTPATSSKLTVDGDATLGGGLSVIPSGSGYGASTSYTILTATGALYGGFGSITSTDASLTPTANVNVAGKKVVLTLTAGSTPPVIPPVTPPVTPSPGTGVIDTSQPSFTNSDEAVQATTVMFDGGTLRPTTALTLPQSVAVTESNGTIALNGTTLTLSGAVGGSGSLAVSEAGNLVVSGSVANAGGVAVRNGGLFTVASGGQVTAPLTLSGGGSASVGGIVGAPVTVGSGGAMTVAAGGGVGGAVTVQGGTVTVADNGIVNGAVTIRSGGNATVSGAVMAPVAVQDGTLRVDGPGSVGAVTVTSGGAAIIDGTAVSSVTIAPGGTLGGSGTIIGPATLSGVLSPGNSPGVLTFRSAVTLTDSNVLRAEIDGPNPGSGAGHHDQLVVQGAGFTAAGTLSPILRGIGGSATNSFTPSVGQSFEVVTADGGVTGRFAAVDQPASGLAAGTRLDVVYGGGSVALAITPSSYGDLAAAGLGQTTNQRAVGAALDTFRPAVNGVASDGAQELFDGLYGLSAGEIGPALNQLSGEIHAATMVAGRANRRLFGRAVEVRQAAGRGSPGALSSGSGAVRFDGRNAAVTGAPGPNGDETNAGGASVWGQPLVAWARSGSDGNGSTAYRRTGGFMVGGDYAIDPDLSAGVALGYLNTDVRLDNGLGKGTVDSYQVTAYGSWTPGAAFVDAAVGYGYTRYDTSRSIAFGGLGGSASGDADGHDLSAELSAGYRITSNRAWVEPRVGLRWDRLQREGFTEQGGSVLNLSEAEETDDALRSSIGARIGTTWTYGEMTVEPTGLLAWEHDWTDVTGEATGSLNGAGFTALSSRPGRDTAVVGAGVNVKMSEQLSVQAGYLGEIRSREASHSLSAGLRWSW
jgi:outer membrane autotransporter protein